MRRKTHVWRVQSIGNFGLTKGVFKIGIGIQLIITVCADSDGGGLYVASVDSSLLLRHPWRAHSLIRCNQDVITELLCSPWRAGNKAEASVQALFLPGKWYSITHPY